MDCSGKGVPKGESPAIAAFRPIVISFSRANSHSQRVPDAERLPPARTLGYRVHRQMLLHGRLFSAEAARTLSFPAR